MIPSLQKRAVNFPLVVLSLALLAAVFYFWYDYNAKQQAQLINTIDSKLAGIRTELKATETRIIATRTQQTQIVNHINNTYNNAQTKLGKVQSATLEELVAGWNSEDAQ